MQKPILSLLRDKSYLSYFFATAFSMGSSNILQFTLALYILDRTGSPVVYASILSIVILPRILLTPVGGVLGDRLERRKIMQVLTLIQAVTIGAYAVYASSGEISLFSVYVLVVILEMVEVFYNAAESSILPEIVEKELLEEAVTLSRVDDGIVYISTPLLAAWIYKQFGIFGSFLLIGVLLVVALALLFFIDTPYASPRKEKSSGGIKTYLSEFLEGVRELKKNRFAKIFVLVAPLINFSFSAIFSVVITYVFLEVLGTGEYLYGIYRMATAGVSVVLPLILLPLVKKIEPERLLRYSSLSIAGFLFLIGGAVTYGMHAGSEKLVPVVIAITILDCLVISSVMPLNIATQVFFQKNIDNAYRSRIMSVFSMLALSSIPLGNMFYGYLASVLPAYLSIFIASFAVLLTYPLTRTLVPDEQSRAK